MNRNYKGYLITLEGPEGGGKTSLIPKIVEWLRTDYRLAVEKYREPGGTIVGEKVRDVLLNDKTLNVLPLTEAFLFQAARAQICQEIIWPALKEGKIVILDRFQDSSRIYQGIVRGIGVETIDFLNKISTGGLTPDLTLLLDVETETGLQRRTKAAEGLNRLDLEKIDFHRKIRQAYLDIAHKDTSDRWKIIDANLEVNVVESSIKNVIKERLISANIIEGQHKTSIERY